MSAKLGLPRADFQATWRRWCHDNIAFIRRYRFWRNQAKEEDEGEEIPIFDEVDITFFSYLMREIADDCPGFVRWRNFEQELFYRSKLFYQDDCSKVHVEPSALNFDQDKKAKKIHRFWLITEKAFYPNDNLTNNF